jgi:hypothetical protein
VLISIGVLGLLCIKLKKQVTSGSKDRHCQKNRPLNRQRQQILQVIAFATQLRLSTPDASDAPDAREELRNRDAVGGGEEEEEVERRRKRRRRF